MDPLSQAALGAAVPQAIKTNQWQRASLLRIGSVGALAGMAPDLDVFIRSSSDPLLALEYHRQFTHALLFIPFGAALVAIALWPLVRRHMTFKVTWFVCLLGYGTHGLLDACTTYGTLLWWPISHIRVAWNNVSVVDPAFTLPLLTAVIIAGAKKSVTAARFGLAWALMYLCVGFIQGQRAVSAGEQLAANRGHVGVQVSAKPSFGNIILWKTVYIHDNNYWVDAIRLTANTHIFEGKTTPKLDISRDLPWLSSSSQQATDIERFRWFSNDHLALDEQDPTLIVDMRYSHLPNDIHGLWGIRVNDTAGPEDHVAWVVRRSPNKDRQRAFWRLLINAEP